jgi:hypothetical protein
MAEFIGGMRSSDDIKIAGNLILSDAGQVGLLADQADGLVHTYSIVFPPAWGASFDFSAVVLTFKVGTFTAKGDAVSFEVTMKVSGAVTLNTTLSTGMTTPFAVFSAAGTTVPALSGSVYEYINSQLTGATSVTITVTAAAGVITLTTPVGDSTLTTGVASSAIALGAAGSITNINVKVKEATKVAKNYVFHILRA